MAKFEFRLQRVLEFREMQEGWAKDAYIEARAGRLEAEATVDALTARKKKALDGNPMTLDERMALERFVQQMDEEVRTQGHIIAILESEEATALAAWQERKRELQAMHKLREHAIAEFDKEEARREQNELDEWTTTRRSA